jgi:hypothetical protein
MIHVLVIFSCPGSIVRFLSSPETCDKCYDPANIVEGVLDEYCMCMVWHNLNTSYYVDPNLVLFFLPLYQ